MTHIAQRINSGFLIANNQIEELSTVVNSPATSEDYIKLSGNRLFSEVSMFFYNEKIRLLFAISGHVNFSLVKGLIEFNRLQNFSFRYDAKARVIETSIDAKIVNELHSFLDIIQNQVNQELQFKKVLKKVLSFEQEYKQQMAAFYSEMKTLM